MKRGEIGGNRGGDIGHFHFSLDPQTLQSSNVFDQDFVYSTVICNISSNFSEYLYNSQSPKIQGFSLIDTAPQITTYDAPGHGHPIQPKSAVTFSGADPRYGVLRTPYVAQGKPLQRKGCELTTQLAITPGTCRRNRCKG